MSLSRLCGICHLDHFEVVMLPGVNRREDAGRPTGYDVILLSRATIISELEHPNIATTSKHSNGSAHQPPLDNVWHCSITLSQKSGGENCHGLCLCGHALLFLVLSRL